MTVSPESQYDHYTRSELEDALAHVDRAAYPERAADLEARIAECTEAEFPQANTFVPLEPSTRRRPWLKRVLLPSAELTFRTPLSQCEVNASLCQAFTDGRLGFSRSLAVLRASSDYEVPVALKLLVRPGHNAARLTVVGTGRHWGFLRVEERAQAELSLQETPQGCMLTLRIPSEGFHSVESYAGTVYTGAVLIGALTFAVSVASSKLAVALLMCCLLAPFAWMLVMITRMNRSFRAPLREHIVSFLREDLQAVPTKRAPYGLHGHGDVPR